MSFRDLGLSSEVLDALTDSGYSTPTPIQEKAIPFVLMGRDVLGSAQTGTGKTAGFVLPMIDILAKGRAKARMPRSLILAPTRELAHQVGESFERYGKYHKLSKALLIGGSSMSEQEQKLDRGVDVLIATPGRLIDLFERGKILLADVKILVIDEADRMLDMGFIPDVERIVGLLPSIRQTLFFSATMPKEVRRLADKFLMNPKEVSVAPPASPAETVEQGLIRVPGADKRKALNQIFERETIESGLIFCNRKRDVSALNKALQKQGLNSGELHGDMAQPVRMETLDRFKNGEITILVCSDVAARGLDMPKVSHVFNYDVPGHPEDYVHRIGRTGRAGRSGKAFMLATPADGKALAEIEKMINRPIPAVDLDKVRILPAEEVEGPVETADSDKPAAQKTDGRKGGRRRRGGSNKTRSTSQPNTQTEDSPDTTPAADASVESGTPSNESAAETDAGEDTSASGDHGQAAETTRTGSLQSKSRAKDGSKAAPSRLKEAAEATASQSRGKQGNRSGPVNKHGESSQQTSNGRTSKPFGDHTPAFLLRPVPQHATA